MFRTILNELKFAARGLRKNPAYAAVAILTLALGIGANAAIFSVVDALVLNPLPLPNLNRLVKVWESAPSRGVDHNELAVANFADFAAQSNSFEHIGAYAFWSVNVSGLDVPERVQGMLVTSGFFPALGVQPKIGRLFLSSEQTTGQDHEVILSYGYWQTHFASDSQILGKSLTLNGVARTVVGVMPANFNFPPGAQLWSPYPLVTDTPSARRSHFLYSVGLLKPRVSVAQAQAELSGIAARLEQQYPQTNNGWRAAVIPLVADVTRDYRLALVVLLSAVGFLLLIACANIANLMLVRTAARRREFAIRFALGAGKLRVIRQLLTESMLLSVFGGAAGILLALWEVKLLRATFPRRRHRIHRRRESHRARLSRARFHIRARHRHRNYLRPRAGIHRVAFRRQRRPERKRARGRRGRQPTSRSQHVCRRANFSSSHPSHRHRTHDQKFRALTRSQSWLPHRSRPYHAAIASARKI